MAGRRIVTKETKLCYFLLFLMILSLCKEEFYGILKKEIWTKEAFRAAHTLKGVCANLSFNKLLDSSSRLTEELRPETDEIPDTAKGMMAEVERDYEATVEAIREFLAEE